MSLERTPSVDETSDIDVETASVTPIDEHVDGGNEDGKYSRPYYEDEDWPRCKECGWELRNGFCTGCGLGEDTSSSTKPLTAPGPFPIIDEATSTNITAAAKTATICSTPATMTADATTNANNPILPTEQPSALYCIMDKIWRCSICLWEIEAARLEPDSQQFYCASGHTLDISNIPPDWIPADCDSNPGTSSEEGDDREEYLATDDDEDEEDTEHDGMDDDDMDEDGSSDVDCTACAAWQGGFGDHKDFFHYWDREDVLHNHLRIPGESKTEEGKLGQLRENETMTRVATERLAALPETDPETYERLFGPIGGTVLERTGSTGEVEGDCEMEGGMVELKDEKETDG